MLNAEKVRYDKLLDQVTTQSIKQNQIIRYFPETFLGNGHNGLTTIAEEAGINVRQLKPGEFLIFVNSSQTALKLYASGNIVAHLKMPGTQKINPRVISMIPRFFNGTEINYNGALKAVINKQFGKEVRA